MMNSNKVIIKTLVWFIFCVFSFLPVNGQLAYQLHNLSTLEGLSEDRYNQYVYQDRTGMVWISSLSGLNRFDGLHVRQYRSDPNNARSLFTDASAQSRIGEDDNNDLWFATALSLSRYNRETDDFDHFRFLDKKGDTIRDLYFWSYVDTLHHQVWCSAGGQLFLQDILSGKQQLVDTLLVSFKDRMFVNSAGDNTLIQPEIDDDYLKITEYSGAHKLGESKRFYLPDGGAIYDALPDERGIVWVATSKGLSGLSFPKDGAPEWLPTIEFRNGQLKEVLEIEITESGSLLIASKQGEYYLYDPLRPKPVLDAIRLRSDNGSGFAIPPLRVTMGEKGDFWISTANEGLYYGNLNAPKWRSCYLYDKTLDKKVIDVALSKTGNPWVLTNNYAVLISPSDTTVYKLPLEGDENDEVTNLFVDNNDNVWVSTFRGLVVKMAGSDSFTKFRLPDKISTSGFYEIRQLSSGNYVIGTNTAWPIHLSADLSVARYWTKKISRVRFIEPGPDNIFLASTLTDSLHLLSYDIGGHLDVDTSITGLGLVNDAIYDEQRGGYWLATMNGPRFLNNTIDSGWVMIIPQGLYQPNSPVSSLWLGPDDVVYFTISGAIMWYNLDGKTSGLFSRSDGVENRNFSFRAVCDNGMGKLIFAGDHGLTIAGRSILTSKLPIRAPIISEILINDELADIPRISKGEHSNASLTRSIFLASGENNITLLVSALDFAEPGRSLLEYRLKGGETSLFRPVSSTGRIELNELAPGNYELELKGTNSDGYEYPDYTRLFLNISPPWYSTWWAYLLYALTLVVAVLVFENYRLRNVRRVEQEQLRTATAEARTAETEVAIKQEQLRAATAEARAAETEIAVQREQIRAATAEARAAETETSILRLQMNPHFIGNSMSSISRFIAKGDKRSAITYVSKFGSLIKSIMERSTEAYALMEQEVELLERYLETEKMRVGERLSYEVLVDDDIEMHHYFLPTMILQPFVENAIWHGIGGRPEGGNVWVRFQLSEDQRELQVEVEDDGIGRNGKANTSPERKISSEIITARRLAHINQGHSRTAVSTSPAPAAAPIIARYEIIDLKHDDGTARGTLVQLFLPTDLNTKT